MADKTLYDILEVSSSASPETIREAYGRLSAKYDPDSTANQTNPGIRIQSDAIKDAFLTVGNPKKRAQYDKKLEVKSRVVLHNVEVVEPFWTMPKLIVLAFIVVFGGGYFYKYKQTEARLAAEKAIVEAKAREAAEIARAEAEQERLALQRQQNETAAEERTRRESEQAIRQLSVDQQVQNRNNEISMSRERQEKQRADTQRQFAEQQAANSAAAAARAQAAREKAELCRVERERYGRSISC